MRANPATDSVQLVAGIRDEHARAARAGSCCSGRNEQRPLLQLDEHERVHRRRQTREDIAVRPRQCCGVAGQSVGELHLSDL